MMSTRNRNIVNRNTVTRQTMVSWINRLRVVQETLLISASVAIRKSAKTGTLTSRHAKASRAIASSTGITRWTLNIKGTKNSPAVNGMFQNQSLGGSKGASYPKVRWV